MIIIQKRLIRAENRINRIIFLPLLILILTLSAGCADNSSYKIFYPGVSVLEDSENTLSLNDILSGKHIFRELSGDKKNLGYSYSSWWIKLTINNPGIPDGDYALIYNQTWTKTVDAYIPSDKGFTLFRAGNENGFKARPLKDTSYAFPVNIKNGKALIFLKLKSNYRLVCDFRLIPHDYYLQRKSITEPFYAIIVAFLIYNFILFIFVRGKEYIYYSCFLITYVIFLLSFDGTGFRYIWSSFPGWEDFALTGMLLFQSFWAILFFIEFTSLNKTLPNAALFLKILAVMTIPAAFLKILLPDKHVLLWSLPLLQIIAVSLISVSLYMAVKGFKKAEYFFISFIILLGFSIINSIISFKITEDLFIIHLGMHIGASVCVILFSLSIAYRINSMRIQQALSEKKVKEQNVQLEYKNEKLNVIMEELKGSNQQLWDSEQMLQGIFDKAPVGIYVININGIIIQVNDYASDMLGYGKNEIKGRSFNELTHTDDLVKERELFEKLSSGEIDSYRYEKRYIKKDGTPWPVDLSTAILHSENGEIYGFIGIAVDITDKIESQKEKEKIQSQLLQTQKQEAIGTLASGIAHDFNNILAAIMGYTELALAVSGSGENPSENLQQILNSSRRARDIVKQILTLSRKSENVKTSQYLISITEEALKLIRATTPATIDISLADNSSGDRILCDHTQIQQVLINLCTNSNHAMAENGGRLTVSLNNAVLDEKTAALHKVKPGEFIMVKVSDTGKGMSNAVMERIFDPFFTTKAPGTGTGLGLSVALGIILDHGGFISAESIEGAGSSFSVYLPLTGESVELKNEDSRFLQGGNERILLVDDEHVIAEMNRLILQRLGYSITTATGSLEALEIFKNSPEDFDLLITDQTMPHMTGISLAKEIHMIRPAVPVILCTGHSDLINAENYYEKGIDEFLYKPVSTEELSDAIRRVLDKKQVSSDLT